MDLQNGDRVAVALAVSGSGGVMVRNVKGRVAGEIVEGMVPVTFKKNEAAQMIELGAIVPLYRYVVVKTPFGPASGIENLAMNVPNGGI